MSGCACRVLSGVSALPNPRASPVTQNWNAPRSSYSLPRPRKGLSQTLFEIQTLQSVTAHLIFDMFYNRKSWNPILFKCSVAVSVFLKKASASQPFQSPIRTAVPLHHQDVRVPRPTIIPDTSTSYFSITAPAFP